jgi:hypothetical protein
MITTCVAGGARELFSRGRDKRRLRKRRPEGFPAASNNKSNTPLMFSANNDAIGDSAATGMLGHAFMPPLRDVVMLPHAVSRWAIPPCCDKDDGRQTPPISHIIRRVHPIKRCGGVGSRHRALKGVTCVVFVWFHQSSSPPIVWGRGSGTSRWECASVFPT